MKKAVNFRGYKTPGAVLKRRGREGSTKAFIDLCRWVGMTDDEIKESLKKATANSTPDEGKNEAT